MDAVAATGNPSPEPGPTGELRAALARLDPTQRMLLHMVYFEHRSQRDVARRLSLSTATIAHQVALGMQALAALIVGPTRD